MVERGVQALPADAVCAAVVVTDAAEAVLASPPRESVAVPTASRRPKRERVVIGVSQ